MGEDTVRVAVRIRPLVKTEVDKGYGVCLDVIPGEPQIQIRNTEKAFTFNHVFPSTITQENFYTAAVKNMISNIFQGYNVTILAYGQTGSGKTYSMGTDYSFGTENIGVIPRAVHDIFEIIKTKEDWKFNVRVSFVELYQEQLYDLLSDKSRSQSVVDIREDVKGIKIVGITEKKVSSADHTLQCLTQGSLGRATGATAMNAQSSRSHAIFTICVDQQKGDDSNTATTAKFHLVDLAGSERSKKTQATGERFKEGVNINKGLLALGNVISQLGEGGPSAYIGYRDSKLTRLLQDSLGGNSVTLMIACVSPADYNLDETLSTLRYADRARKIKNKPIINQDPKASEINRLNKLVEELRMALVGRDVKIGCPSNYQELEEKNLTLQKKLRDLTEKMNAYFIEIVSMHERADLAEQAREKIKAAMAEVLEECDQLLRSFDSDAEDDASRRAKLEAIYLKILGIQNDQKKASEELLNHEISVSCNVPTTSTNNDAEQNGSVINGEDPTFLDYFDEKHEEHTRRQAERNSEVQNINKELAIKEGLVSQLLKNSMTEQSPELQQMEEEIKTLQAEKEELMQALRNAHANNASSKLAETRRKKVQELEKKIGDLTRKCTEQNRIIKAKEKSDFQIRNLANEIQSLKQTRVKLVRQMRNEADKFTKWKQSREKELCKLRDQDRKRANEMARLQLQHNKQQNVMKRKMEEAYAVNKRLKEALDLQKRAHQRREKMNSTKEGVQAWVSQELQVLLSTIDAEYSLQKLIRDRASMAMQLDKLKSNGNAADQAEIAELNECIDLRNAQIVDLQQKIQESDQENRANTRWHMIQTMSDAKAALKNLFEITAEERKKQCAKECDLEELMEENEMLRGQLGEYQCKEKESNTFDKNSFESLNDNKENVFNDVTKLKDELQFYKNRCNQLEQKVLVENNSNTKKLPPKNRKTESLKSYLDEVAVLSDDSILIEDDVEKDPDWTKTPIYNRIQKLWNTTKNTTNDRSTLKRSPPNGSIKCACKTKCATRMCSCRKNDISCSGCGCNPEMCQNKDQENLARTLLFDCTEERPVEESNKRPRLTQ